MLKTRTLNISEQETYGDMNYSEPQFLDALIQAVRNEDDRCRFQPSHYGDTGTIVRKDLLKDVLGEQCLMEMKRAIPNVVQAITKEIFEVPHGRTKKESYA